MKYVQTEWIRNRISQWTVERKSDRKWTEREREKVFANDKKSEQYRATMSIQMSLSIFFQPLAMIKNRRDYVS